MNYIPYGVGYCLLFGLWVFGDTSGQIVAIVPTLLLFYNRFPEGTGKHNNNIMKKIAMTIFCCLLSVAAYSQIPFVTYENTPRNGQTNSNSYNRQQAQPRYQIAAGYYYDSYSQNFKRIKIRINTASFYGQPQVYLKGVYNAQYNMWTDFNNQASKVDAYFDGEQIANNFEWKVQIPNIGTIYFNN